MKVWLGAAAALSGAVTLAYLLVRSSRKGRGNVAPSKATETHTAWSSKTEGTKDSQDATIKKDGSCDRLNGHLPMEGQADSVSGMPLSAECHKEAKQQDSSESTLTTSEASEVNVSVERFSNRLEKNLGEIVCAIQEKVVNEDNESNTSLCEEVNVRLHTDDKEPTPVSSIVTDTTHPLNKLQNNTENNGETRGCVITCAVEGKKTDASSEKELRSIAQNREAICLDTDLFSLDGAACASRLTEPSLASQEPVVEELSQCLILEPQCDPSCCEDHDELHHQTTSILPPESSKCSSECAATINAEEVTKTNTQTEISGITPDRHYTLVLKSSQDDLCISGKHLHDPSPTEPVFAEEFTEGQESGAELNKDEPGTCIVTVERREKVYEKEMSPSPLTSNQEECPLRKESVPSECCSAEGEEDCSGDLEANERTANDNTKEGTVLETDSNMGHPVDVVAAQTLTTEQEHSTKEDTVQDHVESDNKQEIPQEQENISEQEHNSSGQEYSEKEQKITSKQEESIKEQEQSGNDQIVPKEEEQNSHKQTEVPEEQNLSQGKEIKEVQQQEGESKQEVVVQKPRVGQEEQSGSAQETASKQEQNDSKQAPKKQEQANSKPESRQSPKQSGKQHPGAAQKQEQKKKSHKGPAEQKHSTSSIQKQEQEATQKQKEGDRKQKIKQEEQIAEKGGTQKQKNVTQKEEQSISKQVNDKLQNESEVKSSHREDTGTQKQESDKQQMAQREEQSEQVTPPEQSAKDQVTGDQVTHSPSRCNNSSSNGKKGAARSRGDSASADLDLDIGSEQDNLNCDSSSLKSMDSGQGSSEIEPETLFVPSPFPVANQEQYIFFDFEIPQMLVGRLIGRKGAFINKIKAATEATVIVHPHKNRKLKLCSVEGTKQQVNAALEMIREHFPESQYPDITLQQVSSQHQNVPVVQPTLNAPSMQIELTAGVVVEVRVSSVVSGGELWVQQPLHPSYSALHRLQTCMNLNYGDGSNTPPLPNPISDGTVCVAHIQEHWMRCQVLSSLNSMSLVLPLDVGGTVSLPSSSLRQIRYDYMTLPFQATQCFLHGLQPSEGDTWSDIATTVMEELVSGVILFAVVVSYTEDYVPLVNLYRRDQDHFVLLNEKLVELGHAQWISPQPSS